MGTQDQTGFYTRLLAAVLGFWLLMRAVNADSSGRTLIDRLLGNKSTKSPYLQMTAPVSSQVGSALTSPSAAGSISATGQTDPFPGATASRLDQGIDVTAKTFLSPFAGVVKVATSSDPGWAGGGYVAIQSLANPHQVVYFAEGLTPSVKVGERVSAGQQIAQPATNPYNGIVGNIEFGPANPSNPGQPFAQVASNPVGVVQSFYQWLLKLGGPKSPQTSNAGYP
jgi:hypothetical protein